MKLRSLQRRSVRSGVALAFMLLSTISLPLETPCCSASSEKQVEINALDCCAETCAETPCARMLSIATESTLVGAPASTESIASPAGLSVRVGRADYRPRFTVPQDPLSSFRAVTPLLV